MDPMAEDEMVRGAMTCVSSEKRVIKAELALRYQNYVFLC
jgi:hypothetical protein